MPEDAAVPYIAEEVAGDVLFCAMFADVLFWYTAEPLAEGKLKPAEAAVPTFALVVDDAREEF